MDTTKNYGLKQWDGSDRILRTDFNENNLSIEAALDAKQENIDALEARITASLTALESRLTASIANLSQTVNTNHASRVRIITGEYTGDGNESTARSISIGEEVSLIVIWNSSGETLNTPYSIALLVESGHYAGDGHGAEYIQHTGSGFTITMAGADRFNTSERVYKYLAFVLGT